MNSPRRRKFLQAVTGISAVGVAGCLRMGGGDSTETADPTPTESTTTTPERTATPSETETPGSERVTVPDDANYTFEYTDGAVTVEQTSPSTVPAQYLVIQSTEGTRVRWDKLGSTSVRADEVVTAGETARIGASVLNWPDTIGSSETIRVIFEAPDGGSPTTLATFEPTQTADDSDETAIADFEDGWDGFDVLTNEKKAQGTDANAERTTDSTTPNGEWAVRVECSKSGDDGDVTVRKRNVDVSGADQLSIFTKLVVGNRYGSPRIHIFDENETRIANYDIRDQTRGEWREQHFEVSNTETVRIDIFASSGAGRAQEALVDYIHTDGDGTTTEEDADTIFSDTFEDGEYESTWNVTSEHDEESVTEQNGVFTYSSPADATLYAPDMTVVTREEFDASGTYEFKARFRTESSRRVRIFRVLEASSDDKITLNEVGQNDEFTLSLPSETVAVDTNQSDGQWRTYELTIDFDTNQVVSVSRAGETYQLDRDLGAAFDKFRLGIGEGNGESQFEFIRISRV